jgi:hypothetical protein
MFLFPFGALARERAEWKTGPSHSFRKIKLRLPFIRLRLHVSNPKDRARAMRTKIPPMQRNPSASATNEDKANESTNN